MAGRAVQRKLVGRSFEYYDVAITAPLRERKRPPDEQLASYPDTPSSPGDAANDSPPPILNAEDLAAFDILVTGDNYSQQFGRALLVELFFGSTDIELEDLTITLHLARCELRLKLDKALTDRGDQRTIADTKYPELKMNISAAQGTARDRFWKISHVETTEPLLGTFMVASLPNRGRVDT